MFAVFTDTSANIDTPMARERAITVIPFSYYIDGVEQTTIPIVAGQGVERLTFGDIFHRLWAMMCGG